MAKVRGNFMYTDSSDKLFGEGEDYPASQEIEKFCKDVLDKNFENWMVVGRDQNPTRFKEVEGGNLMSGMIALNLRTVDAKEKLTSSILEKSPVRDINAKANLAMMIMDLIEAVCDSEDEAEKFAEALAMTLRRGHASSHRKHGGKDGGREVQGMNDKGEQCKFTLTRKEEIKIDVLKDLLWKGVDIFDSYKARERFLRSCLSSLVLARILETDDERLKARLRVSMKASVAGDKDGGKLAMDSVDGIDEWVETLLNAIDEGKSAEEIKSIMETLNDNL